MGPILGLPPAPQPAPSNATRTRVCVYTFIVPLPAAPKDSRAQNSWAPRPNYPKPLQSGWVGRSGGSGRGTKPVGAHSGPTGREVEGRRGRGEEKDQWPRDPGPLRPGAGRLVAAGIELPEGSLRPWPCRGGRGRCRQGASGGSHWEAGNGPPPLSGRSRPLQGQWQQIAPGSLEQPCPRGPRSLPRSGTGAEGLRSPAVSEPSPKGSLTLPPDSLPLLRVQPQSTACPHP